MRKHEGEKAGKGVDLSQRGDGGCKYRLMSYIILVKRSLQTMSDWRSILLYNKRGIKLACRKAYRKVSDVLGRLLCFVISCSPVNVQVVALGA